MFSIGDVQWFLQLAESLDILVWLDGGWGVDAHVGLQRGPHGDLDIAVQTRDGDLLTDALALQGFVEIELDHRLPHNFVYGQPDGRKIDFHLFDFDAAGNGVYGDRGPIRLPP